MSLSRARARVRAWDLAPAAACRSVEWSNSEKTSLVAHDRSSQPPWTPSRSWAACCCCVFSCTSVWREVRLKCANKYTWYIYSYLYIYIYLLYTACVAVRTGPCRTKCTQPFALGFVLVSSCQHRKSAAFRFERCSRVSITRPDVFAVRKPVFLNVNAVVVFVHMASQLLNRR